MQRVIFCVVLLISFAVQMPTAIADPAPPIVASESMNTIEKGILAAIDKNATKLQAIALTWLSGFIFLQFLITNFGLLKSGADIEAIIGKLIGTIAWFSVCFYIVANGAGFIQGVGNGFFEMAMGLMGGSTYNAGHIMNKGVVIASNVMTTVQHIAGITDIGSVIIAGIGSLFILAVVALIAFKIFIIKIELAIVIMMSPLSFAFLGLNALKDQGIAPFKSLISLAYRIILLGVIVSSLDTITMSVSTSLTDLYDNADWFTKITGVGNGLWPALFGLIIGYLAIGYLTLKSDSIASSLASGGTNMGTGDVATAAAMGAAAGAAVASGGASAAAGAAKAGKPMGDVIKNLMGGGGAMKNESPTGSGGERAAVGTAPAPLASKPAMSMKEMNDHPAAIGNKKTTSGALPSASGGKPTDSMASESSKSPGSSDFVGPVPSPLIPTDSMASESSKSPGSSDFVGPVPPPPTPPAPPSGSGATAGIGGAGQGALGDPEKKMDAILDALSKPAQKPSFGERMSTLNDHVAREQAATHVSINANAGD